MTAYQKAVIAQEVMPMLEEEARKRNIDSAKRLIIMQEKLKDLNKKADGGDKLADWEAYIISKEYRNLDKKDKKRVYFVECKDKIKIGLSDCPEIRLDEIKRSNPEAKLLGHIKGDIELEKYLHKQFGHLSKGHEWFDNCDELKNEINEILDFGKNSKVGQEEFHTSIQASKMFNVNEKYIRDIKKLKESGKIDKIEAIRSGKLTLQDVKKRRRTTIKS